MGTGKLSSATIWHFECTWAWFKSTAGQLHLNNNKSETNGTVLKSVSVLWRLCLSWHITFFKTWVSLHPTRETPPLHLLRVLKKVTSPLDSFMTTRRAWRSMRHVKTIEIPLLISYPTTAPALFWTLKSVLRQRQMTLGNYVSACFHKNNRLRKVSLVELDMKKYVFSQAVYILCIITTFLPHTGQWREPRCFSASPIKEKL